MSSTEGSGGLIVWFIHDILNIFDGYSAINYGFLTTEDRACFSAPVISLMSTAFHFSVTETGGCLSMGCLVLTCEASVTLNNELKLFVSYILSELYKKIKFGNLHEDC